MHPMIESRYADLTEVRLHYRIAGTGPTLLLLLHGWPQTSLCWQHVQPRLASRYTVVAPDLRGYGDSGFAASGYDKRTTAADLAELVTHLGADSTLVAGHDRGGRVAHRWALDRPDQVRALALLDILPTREVMHGFDLRTASSTWHWFFHRQPDLPERLIGADVDGYLRHFLTRTWEPGCIDEASIAEYVRAFSNPESLHASLEDYRAGFTADLAADDADHAAGHVLAQPVLLLWGADGLLGDRDVPAAWRGYADDIRWSALERCRHYLPEERPAEVADRLGRFFAEFDG